MAKRPANGSGYFPKCDEYVRRAGLKNTQVAQAAELHEQSIRRARAGKATSTETTIRRIVNALNSLYYDKHPPRIDFDSEYKAHS